jgi:hypothetical protein
MAKLSSYIPWTAVLGLSILTCQARGDGLVYRLPADGDWVAPTRRIPWSGRS